MAVGVGRGAAVAEGAGAGVFEGTTLAVIADNGVGVSVTLGTSILHDAEINASAVHKGQNDFFIKLLSPWRDYTCLGARSEINAELIKIHPMFIFEM